MKSERGGNSGKVKILVTLIMALLVNLQASRAYAAITVQEFFCRIQTLLSMAAVILGPGLGLIFVLMGIAKIRRKDDDPRAAGQGVWLIIAGVGCALTGLILKMLVDYFGASLEICAGSQVYFNRF